MTSGGNAVQSGTQSMLTSSPKSASMKSDDALIPWMPSDTKQACLPVAAYTHQQEQTCGIEQESSRSQSHSATAPMHCLETEINLTSLSMPAGNILDTSDRGPVILDSATGQPCTVMRMFSNTANPESSSDVTGRVIVCTYAEQVTAIEERANVCDVCPPVVPLQMPVEFNDGETPGSMSSTLRSAPAVCFACTETLADEIASGTSRSSPEAAGLLLASLCALLERLHVAGYTSGGLTPDIVVRPEPFSKPADWRLLCAHSVLQQGSTAEPVVPLNIRWCAPEQLMFAKGAGGVTAQTGVLSTMQQSSTGGEKRASPINTPSLAIADVASDMFCLGLILYNAVTGCDYWGDYTDEQVAEVLLLLIGISLLLRNSTRGRRHSHPVLLLQFMTLLYLRVSLLQFIHITASILFLFLEYIRVKQPQESFTYV
jgi:hypothetical protein